MRDDRPRGLDVGRVAAVLLLVASWSAPVSAGERSCPAGAEEAAVAGVRAVFGEAADVTLTGVVCEAAAAATRADEAVPEPGSRSGGPVRFVLYATEGATRVRAGRLTAVVAVSAPHVRTVAAQPARTRIARDMVTVRHASVGRVPFGPLPTCDEVVGQQLRRAATPDAVLTMAAIERTAIVRSGGEVVTVARVEGLEVRGRAVAAQSGDLGDVVIVVNPDSRKRLRGRVVAPATVEVLHVS